tara:strand:+ start:153 stop:671 length:519 start_codon:yes stop_codon:yes gene_type:complete
MRKILLSEIAIYHGQIKMPEYFEIDRETIFYHMLKEGVNKEIKETPFSRELDKLRTYIREYIFIKHGLVLENFGTESDFYFPHERSRPTTHLDPMNPKQSPDYVCLYGVNVGKDSCKIIIEYDNNKIKGCVKEMSLNNNDFVLFPSTLKYHIDKNRSEQLNSILVVTYLKKR